MPWFKVDDGFHDHPKVDELSLEAIGLWTLCGTWSSRHLTDGEVPWSRVLKFGGSVELCSELVRANMWRTSEDVRDGAVPNAIFFVNWNEWNPTKNDVEADRKKARDRMKRIRDQGKRSPEQTANERRSSEDVRDPRPDPSIKEHAPQKGGKKKPAIPIPDDWKPTQAHAEQAAKLGLDLEDQAERFRNWALSKDERKVRWDQAFSNWLAKSNDFQPWASTAKTVDGGWGREQPY